MRNEQDLLSRIREARRRLAADGPPRVRAAGDFERVSVPGPDSDALRDLLLAEQPPTVIEIGLAYGSSEPIPWPTRLRAFRLPAPRTEPSFDSFRPFGLCATG